MLTQTVSNEVAIHPQRIMQIGYGFWSSKVLLTAVNFELFTLLSDTSKTAEEIRIELDLHPRGLADFLDALVALKFLYREGDSSTARYGNTVETDTFLNKKRATYLGGILEMVNNRLYHSWGKLEKGLQTGQPQNEIQPGQKTAYDSLYSNERKLSEFVLAMSAAQRGTFTAFAKQFHCNGYRSHCDLGGAAGDLSIQLAIHHPQVKSTTFDLPGVASIAQKNIEKYKVSERVKVASGDFFADELPKADIITLGNILHNWGLKERKILIKKVFNALPEGGALIAIENMIDDERRENLFGLLMSLNMLLNTGGGENFTAADFTCWVKEAGFSRVEVLHITGPASALIAYK